MPELISFPELQSVTWSLSKLLPRTPIQMPAALTTARSPNMNVLDVPSVMSRNLQLLFNQKMPSVRFGVGA